MASCRTAACAIARRFGAPSCPHVGLRPAQLPGGLVHLQGLVSTYTYLTMLQACPSRTTDHCRHKTEHYTMCRMRCFRFPQSFFNKSSLPGCNATSIGVPRRFERTEERNILCTMKRRKTNWIGHTLLRNCIEGSIEGSIEVMRRRGRRSNQLLDDLKEKRGYWRFKEEALDRTLWRTGFGRGYGLS